MNKELKLNQNKIIEGYLNLAKSKLTKFNRSITGKETLKLLNVIKKEFKTFKIYKIRSGKKVFDWKIPNEWNVKEAYIIDKFNEKIIDLKNNNLHLVGYSEPTNKILNKKKLLPYLHSLPNQPSAIPYVTSYYRKNWGFCITENQKKKLKKNIVLMINLEYLLIHHLIKMEI